METQPPNIPQPEEMLEANETPTRQPVHSSPTHSTSPSEQQTAQETTPEPNLLAPSTDDVEFPKLPSATKALNSEDSPERPTAQQFVWRSKPTTIEPEEEQQEIHKGDKGKGKQQCRMADRPLSQDKGIGLGD